MLLPVLLMLSLQAASPQTAPQTRTYADDPPTRVARLSALEGPVLFQASGDSGAASWTEAPINYALTSGDRLYAEAGGRAELEVGDCTLRMMGTADVTIATLADDFLQVSLAAGTMRVSVYDLSGGDSIEIDTPNGAVLLRQRGAYRLDVSEANNATLVSVDRGLAEVLTGTTEEVVSGGGALSLAGFNPIRIARVAVAPPDGFDRWSAERDRALASSVSARYVGRDVPGYEDLDHAGRWETDPSYGPVWYPTVIAADWAPYRFGRWVWIDPWGWTWVDDAPWGFVPFHYGRWVLLRRRWAWVPGRVVRRPCYAPALVQFVTVGVTGVQAWFPLGPGEPYHAWYHHGPVYRARVNPSITIVRTSDVHFKNRPYLTVVPISAFRGGESVRRRMLRVTAKEVAQTQVIAHPRVDPTLQAARGGSAARRAPARPRPTTHVVRRRPAEAPRGVTPPATATPTRTERPTQPPARRRPAEPTRAPTRTEQPARPPAPRVIGTTPPATQALPFPVRQKAMRADPGRPLEPAQRQNLREGKPAGPHRDPQDPSPSAARRTPVKKPAQGKKPRGGGGG